MDRLQLKVFPCFATQDLFKSKDVDQSGCMSSIEMRVAVEEAGEKYVYYFIFLINYLSVLKGELPEFVENKR